MLGQMFAYKLPRALQTYQDSQSHWWMILVKDQNLKDANFTTTQNLSIVIVLGGRSYVGPEPLRKVAWTHFPSLDVWFLRYFLVLASGRCLWRIRENRRTCENVCRCNDDVRQCKRNVGQNKLYIYMHKRVCVCQYMKHNMFERYTKLQ